MLSFHDSKLIEEKLPLKEVNADSLLEASFKALRGYFDPKLRNIHVWFARRPAGVARVLTAASILPPTISIESFKDMIGFASINVAKKSKMPPLLFYTKPKQDLVELMAGKSCRDIVVVDPMAGGGSIPLESLRLGFRTIAVEYNPVAYLILKATVEFPAKYADSGLFEEALRAAKDFIERAREGLSRYYGEDAENYIFARGVRCPFCGGLIPVQGIAPQITGSPRFKKRYLRIEFDREKKEFIVETTDTKPGNPLERRRNNIKCPYCDKWFQLRGGGRAGQTAFDRWFQDHANLMKSVVEGWEKVTQNMEERLLELHIPLVKQVGNSFTAIWDNREEKNRFAHALRDLSDEIFDLQDYIPIDMIPVENRWATTARNKGLTHWYMLFNPRQLLAVAKLSKLVSRMADSLVSKNGEFGAAVALYIAFAIDKIVDYNTIATKWQGSAFKTGIGNTMRGESTIDFRQEYCEIKRIDLALQWALEPHVAESGRFTRTAGGILPVLRFLCDEFRGAGLGDRVSVYMGDATELSKILGAGVVDVVNVDPPYFEQVIYSDRSEFFWVILRRALRPALELLFRPGLRLAGWSWNSPSVPRDREVVAHDKDDSSGRFRRFFREFIRETYKVLKGDGVLVLWFTHPTDIAWRTIGESLYNAGYVVSKVWPLKTEMRTRYKGQVNVVAQETSLVIVARKYQRKRLAEVGGDVARSLLDHPEFIEVAETVVEETRKVSGEAGGSPADMMALMLGSALSIATRFEIPGLGSFEPVFDAAATKVDELFIEPLISRALAGSGPVKLPGSSANMVVEYVRRSMLRDAATRSYITLWFLSRVDLETGRPRETPLPLSYDFVQTVSKLLGYDIERLRKVGLVGESLVGEAEDNEGDGEEGTDRGRGRVFYPLMFEALSASSAKTAWAVLSSLVPGRALFLAYLALHESGAPQVRANSIKGKAPVWSSEEIAEAASIAIVLLETARDTDLGLGQPRSTGLDRFLQGGSESPEPAVARELAIRTLLHLISQG